MDQTISFIVYYVSMGAISIGQSMTRSFKMPYMGLRDWMSQSLPKGDSQQRGGRLNGC
jgi:hypothetical protein